MTSAGDVSYPNPNGNNAKDIFTNGPIMDNIKTEASRTGNEFRDLKNSKVTPSSTASTGQPLTYYHSLLYSLLSWEQPRATATSYLSVITFIFAARYLPLLRWVFKLAYVALGFTAAFEIGGRLAFGQGLSSSFRPRKYYTVPRETIEAVLEDLVQLLDFGLLEFQRVLFVENIAHTVAAFFGALNAYWLIKFLPFWGLSLIVVTIAYFGPLTYMNHSEVIDAHIEEAQSIVNSHANQLKDLVEERAARATGVVKQYLDDYSNKASDFITPRPRSASPELRKVSSPVIKKEPSAEPELKPSAFPEAPKAEPVYESIEQREPLLAS
jgi:hypothetical protein